mgnify:CR=1 FL=1
MRSGEKSVSLEQSDIPKIEIEDLTDAFTVILQYASKDMLCGARGAVFREIFIFHYPDFIGKVQELIPGVTKDEELLCMLVALGQSVEEIEKLFCLPAEQVYMFHKSVCWKMRLEGEKQLGDKLREILEE